MKLKYGEENTEQLEAWQNKIDILDFNLMSTRIYNWVFWYLKQTFCVGGQGTVCLYNIMRVFLKTFAFMRAACLKYKCALRMV